MCQSVLHRCNWTGSGLRLVFSMSRSEAGVQFLMKFWIICFMFARTCCPRNQWRKPKQARRGQLFGGPRRSSAPDRGPPCRPPAGRSSRKDRSLRTAIREPVGRLMTPWLRRRLMSRTTASASTYKTGALLTSRSANRSAMVLCLSLRFGRCALDLPLNHSFRCHFEPRRGQVSCIRGCDFFRAFSRSETTLKSERTVLRTFEATRHKPIQTARSSCHPTQTSGPLSSCFGVLPGASADTSEPDW